MLSSYEEFKHFKHNATFLFTYEVILHLYSNTITKISEFLLVF